MPATYFDPLWIKFREELLTMDVICLLGINKFNVIGLGALLKVLQNITNKNAQRIHEGSQYVRGKIFQM
jgi:hypothetical protein